LSYTYAIASAAMFEDRSAQFVTLGIPRADVRAMRDTITDMWTDAPGGWVYEWSKLAERYRMAGQAFLASLAYGCAKFPCLANAARKTALARQVESYLAAAPGFPVKFERRLIEMQFMNRTVSLIGNDMGYDHQPDEAEFAEALGKLSRRMLLDRTDNAPMLVINGADDYFVPQADTGFSRGARGPRCTLLRGRATAPSRSCRRSWRSPFAGFSTLVYPSILEFWKSLSVAWLSFGDTKGCRRCPSSRCFAGSGLFSE
jgi:hypothetical protein